MPLAVCMFGCLPGWYVMIYDAETTIVYICSCVSLAQQAAEKMLQADALGVHSYHGLSPHQPLCLMHACSVLFVSHQQL